MQRPMIANGCRLTIPECGSYDPNLPTHPNSLNVYRCQAYRSKEKNLKACLLAATICAGFIEECPEGFTEEQIIQMGGKIEYYASF